MPEHQQYPPASQPTSPPGAQPIPPQNNRAVSWLIFFSDAGVRVEVVLGADVVQLEGDRSAALAAKAHDASRDLCTLARYLVDRDRHDAVAVALGLEFRSADGRARLRVRQASIDEQLAAQVARLRSSRGTALRRIEADAIASLLEALAQRAAQPCRGRAA